MYAPQPGLSAEEKDHFYAQLLVLVTSETLVQQGFSRHRGGYGRKQGIKKE